MNLPHAKPMTLTEARAVPAEQWLGVLREAFADDRTPALDLLRRTEAADLLVVGPMEDIPTVPAWSKRPDGAHRRRRARHVAQLRAGRLTGDRKRRAARPLPARPTHQQAFAAYEQLRRARVEKVIARAARTNSDKAAGPIARVLRDLLMPVAMKRLAKPEKMAWQFDYRIDWDAPVTDVPNRVPARAYAGTRIPRARRDQAAARWRCRDPPIGPGHQLVQEIAA